MDTEIFNQKSVGSIWWLKNKNVRLFWVVVLVLFGFLSHSYNVIFRNLSYGSLL